MPYRYLEDIAIADVAFEAWGETCAEMFSAAADAQLNVMVADPAAISAVETVEIRLENEDLEMLLFNFLNELVFQKDARLLLLRVRSLEISTSDAHFSLVATASGERLDPARHQLLADVKAVTLHRLRVEKLDQGWRGVVVLDI